MREYGPADDSAPWTLATANSIEEARVILPVLAAVALEEAARQALGPPGRGAARSRPLLTVEVARWVVRVAAVAADLPPFMKYLVALEYRAWERRGDREDTTATALTVFLACRPWADEGMMEWYPWCVTKCVVPGPVPLAWVWWRAQAQRAAGGWARSAANTRGAPTPPAARSRVMG